MSRIGELGPKLKNLPAVLASYDEDIEKAKEVLPIKGKTLDEAFKEQCAWPVYFYNKKAEVRTLLKYLEQQVAKVRGERFRAYVEQHSRELGERTIDKYINNEESFLMMDSLRLEVEEVYETFQGIVESFDKRGFALRDYTTARTNDFHRDEI